MNTPSEFSPVRLSRFATALALLSLTWVPPLPAQSTAPAADEELLSFNFPGGSPAELIALIAESSGDPLNVVIPPNLQDAHIGPLSIKRATFSDLADALTEATSAAQISRPSGRGGFTPVPTSIYGFRKIGNIWYFFAEGTVPTDPDATTTRAFLLHNVVEHFEIEDVYTLLQEALKANNLAEPKLMRFHAETGILLTSLNGAQETAVVEVIGALEDLAEQKSTSLAQSNLATEKLNAQKAAWERQVSDQQATLSEALTRSEAMKDEVQKLNFELRQSERAHQQETLKERAEAEIKLLRAEERIRMLADEISRLKAGAAKGDAGADSAY